MLTVSRMFARWRLSVLPWWDTCLTILAHHAAVSPAEVILNCTTFSTILESISFRLDMTVWKILLEGARIHKSLFGYRWEPKLPRRVTFHLFNICVRDLSHIMTSDPTLQQIQCRISVSISRSLSSLDCCRNMWTRCYNCSLRVLVQMCQII